MSKIIDAWQLAADNPVPFIVWAVIVCAVTACVTSWYYRAQGRGRRRSIRSADGTSATRGAPQADLPLRPSQHALDQLRQLLQQGLEGILNARVQSEDELAEYLRFCDEWDRRLYRHMDENFALPDAMHVRKLGALPEIDFEGVVFKKQRIRMTWFCRREQLIRDILEKHQQAAAGVRPAEEEIEPAADAALYAVSR